MSLQIQSGGRRTPLSLSGSVQTSGKSGKPKPVEVIDLTDKSDKKKLSENGGEKSKEEKKASIPPKVAAAISQKATGSTAKENPSKKSVTVVTTAKAAAAPDASPKVVEEKKKETPKKEDKKAQNGLASAEKEAKATNGVKKNYETGNGEKAEKVTPSAAPKRGSARQKETVKENEEAEVKETTTPKKESARQKETVKEKEEAEVKETTTPKKEIARQKETVKEREAAEEKETTPKEIVEEKKSKREEGKAECNKKKEIENETTPQKVDKRKESDAELQGFNEVDVMEPLIFEPELSAPVVSSTPGKLSVKTKASTSIEMKESNVAVDAIPTPDRQSCPPTYRSISGRRSFRPTKEYTFQSNSSLRESYRQINTELDVSNNTSLNVTVGSEVPSNWSYSFFGRSRKRERTPPMTEPTSEMQGDMDASPKSPKRARLDFTGILGIFSSPVTMLRDRLARTKIQSSTPNKLAESKNDDEGDDVVNVSGISVEDEQNEAASDDTENVTVANEADADVEVFEDMDEKPDTSDVEIAEPNDDDDLNMKTKMITEKKTCSIM